MKLTSTALKENELIPGKYAFCIPDTEMHASLGNNKNPPLEWGDLPVGTKSLALICHDPDVPSKPDDVNQEGRVVPADLPRTDFFHWILVDLPPQPPRIEEGEFSSLVSLMRNNDNESHHLYMDIIIIAGNFSVFWHDSEVSPTINPTNSTYTLDIGNLGPGDIYGTSPQLTAYLPTGVVLVQYVVIISLRTEEGVTEEVSLLLTIR